ncbi:putative endonuclease [Escherichia coli]|nr:putative endonuclease [Escherichia coli]
MPWQPLRRCTEPGCNRRVKSGKCEEHRRAAWRAEDARRGHRRARGYSRQWDKYRAMYLSKNPLCVRCLEKGIYTPAVVVDHIIPSMAAMMFSSGPNGTISHCVRRVITRKRNGLIRQQKASVPQVDFVKMKNGPLTAITGCMTLMNEREQNRLIRGLIRQRDAWKTQETGHKDKASGRAERITAKRLTDRDREVMECFRNR